MTIADPDALAAAWTRIVIAVGAESSGAFTGRTANRDRRAAREEATVLPSRRGGFLGLTGYAGQPKALAQRLREVLGD